MWKSIPTLLSGGVTQNHFPEVVRVGLSVDCWSGYFLVIARLKDEVCFVEFDIMHDLANVYKLKERKYEFPTVQRLLNTSNLVTPAVKFAIRQGPTDRYPNHFPGSSLSWVVTWSEDRSMVRGSLFSEQVKNKFILLVTWNLQYQTNLLQQKILRVHISSVLINLIFKQNFQNEK